MANARKCDRCGKCFDPFEARGMMCRFRNPIFQSSNDIREGVVGKTMVNDGPDAYVDLCPECSELFDYFINGVDPREMEEDPEEEKEAGYYFRQGAEAFSRTLERIMKMEDDQDG